MKQRHSRFIFTLLIISGFLSWKLYSDDYLKPQSLDIYTFPNTIDQWTSEELPFEKIDKTILGNNSILNRLYNLPQGKHVHLYIVYSPTNPKAANPPELYYSDLGVSVLDKGKKTIKISALDFKVKVNWLLVDNNSNQQVVYYWFKVGDLYTTSYWKQQALIAFNNLIGKKKGSALIRISADVLDGRQQDTINLINKFSDLIVPRLSQYLP